MLPGPVSPVARPAPARDELADELAIKLALAGGSPLADARDVVQVQRTATMRAPQEYSNGGGSTGAPPSPSSCWWPASA